MNTAAYYLYVVESIQYCGGVVPLVDAYTFGNLLVDTVQSAF